MKKFFSFFAALLFAGSMMAANYELFTGALVEGDYLITYSGGAMKASIASNRFEYAEVTATADVVSDPAANLVWHLAKVGDNWTIYNADQQKYAGSSNAKNQGALLDDATTDNSKWIVTGTETYDFENVARAAGSDPNNKWLRRNGNYGFACYASGTGGALTLYKLQSGEAPAVAKPSIAGETFFYNEAEVTITCATEGAKIYYTLDGTEPAATSTEYTAAFKLTETKTVKAIAIKGEDKSVVAEKKFTKNPSFDSFEALVAAELENNTLVEVAFTDVVIDSIYVSKSSSKRQGVYFTVGEKAYEIYYNKDEVPEAWEAGGKISGAIRGNWTYYGTAQIWELVPSAADWKWENLTYKTDEPILEDWTIIDFNAAAAAADLPEDTTFTSGLEGFKAQISDTGNKMSIDGNVARFGVAAEYDKLNFRLKSGGKTDKGANYITVSVPADCKLRIAVRTGSNSETNRNLIVAQGSDTLYNQVVKEADAIEVMEDTNKVKIYPYVEVAVKAGDIVLTYPTGSLNFYGFACNVPLPPQPTDAPAAAPAEPTWPANQVKAVYSAKYEADCGFGEWGSGTVYTQDTYGKKYVTTNLGYFGLTFEGEGQRLNCAKMEKLHLDVWIVADASIRVVPIWKAGGAEKGVTANLTGGQWNSVEISLSEYDNVTDWTDIYQIKIVEAKEVTFWLNNVYFYTTQAPEADTVAPTNVTAEVAETSFFSVRIKANAIDNSGYVKFNVINGELTVGSATGESGKDTYINVGNLAADTEYEFTVVAKDESGNMAEGIKVTAKTKATPAAAPAPNFEGKETVAVFCDALENNPAIAIGSWEQSTLVEKSEIVAGDNVYYCSNMNYLGWEFTPHINATGMEYVHVDFYATNMESINLTPISPAHEGSYKVTLTANQWTSVDVPLSAFDAANIDWSDIYQFKFMEATPDKRDLFIDNVYFFKNAEEGFENVDANATAVKRLVNGMLVIEKNGKFYTATGVEIK